MDSWTRLWFIRFDLGFRFKLFALLKSCNNLNLKPRSNLINPSHVQESFIIIPLLRIFLYFFVYRCRSGNPHKNFEMHAYLKGLHFIIKSVKVAGVFRLLWLFNTHLPSPSLLLLFFLRVLFHFRGFFLYVLDCALRPDFVVGNDKVEEEVIYGNKKHIFNIKSL